MSEEEKTSEAVIVDQYIGASKVVKTEPRDKDFVHYELADGRTGLVRFDQLNSMEKDQPYEDGLIISYKWMPVNNQIYKILSEYDMPMSDLGFIIKQLHASVVENADKASAKLFKRQSTDNVRLSQVNEIIESKTELIVE